MGKFKFLSLLALAALTSIFAGKPGQLFGQTLPELTTVRDIRALTPDQARQGRPVRLRGIVTVLSGWKSSFFFQDATAGISVDRTNDSPEVKPGQSVELSGVTGPGLFAPIVIAQSLTVLGRGKLPHARLFGADKLAGGNQDSQWLAIRGMVRSAVVKPSWGRSVLFLEVDIGAGNLVTLRVHDYSSGGLDRLAGSTIYARGVCGTVFNDKRQFIGLRLFVAGLGDVKVERPAPADPFDIPTRSLGGLLQFGDQGTVINRVKVRGVVTYSQPGHGLYIQDGSQGIFVRSDQATPVAPGSQLEVVGYPVAGRYSPKLDNALFRIVSVGQPLSGLALSASAMIAERDGFSSAPYDSVLVQIKGRLIEDIPRDDEDLLLLRDGASLFTARLRRSGRNRRALPIGSLWSITGVCAANSDEDHEPHSFEILLRSPTDLLVLEKAPWWTASHVWWLVTLLTVVVIGMAAGMTAVRRNAGLRLLTVTDPLTGLYNRRGFLLFAEQHWQVALRRKMCCLLFYVDVDRFKEINDSLGHKQGDLALLAVATILRETFRKTDVIGRMGGDEFAVVVFDAPPSSRAVLEHRLSETVQQSNQRAADPFQLSLSVGVLTCDNSMAATPIEELLAQADALMYQQKRNRGA